MVKFGIISDTHLSVNDDIILSKTLISQLKDIFLGVDEIIHSGDISEQFILDLLEEIAPIRSVKGESDKITGLEAFIKISANKYNIGVIHEKPEDLEGFFKINNIHILIFGHTHQPLIKGTSYNTLLINPGSPTKPVAPPPKRGFEKPIAKPTVITLNIDEDNILSTFVINLKNS
ncbi:MAG: YfcE family phosphodiesterase [Candidatus Lokiarchaeota archaeon]|nr:YfcE family phosphodiesterase [Candidatus Lokiarchaeota archaeon]